MTEDATPIRWTNLPWWAYRTAGSDWITYTKKRPLGFGRVLGSIVPRLRRPIFLVGAPRSGTTFLGQCLGELPDVSYHYEPVVTKAAARYVCLGEWSHGKAARFYRLVYRWLLRLHLAGDLRFAEKTPQNSFVVPFLARAFPDAQFVHIVRDGRDAALSLLAKPWLRGDATRTGKREPGGYRYGPHPRFWVERDRLEEFSTTTDLHRCIWSWRRHAEAALEHVDQLPEARRHQLRYEDLVVDPRGEAKRLMEFLGVTPPSPGFVTAMEGARPDSVGRWKNELTSEQRAEIQREAGGLLERLGYSCDG